MALRIAWRALTFAGLRGSDRMRQLERILRAERAGKGIFATVLSLAIPPEGPVTAVRAGHPGMLLHGGGTVEWVEPAGGPALGLHAGDWEPLQVDLPEGKGLVLLTDGLFEGHIGHGNERLGEAGLLELARTLADLPGRAFAPVPYTHLRAHETVLELVCRLLLEKKKQTTKNKKKQGSVSISHTHITNTPPIELRTNFLL